MQSEFLPVSPQGNVQCSRCEKQDADDAVDGKECSVDFPRVTGFSDQMLVCDEPDNKEPSHPEDDAQLSYPPKGSKHEQENGVEKS